MIEFTIKDNITNEFIIVSRDDDNRWHVQLYDKFGDIKEDIHLGSDEMFHALKNCFENFFTRMHSIDGYLHD